MVPRFGDGNPMYTVIEFTFSNEDNDSEFIVMCNGKRFIIRLFADSFSESPSLNDRYLFFLRVADEFELEGQTVDDFYDWVLEPFLPLLRAIPPIDQDAKPTLHDFFYPETTFYTLGVVEGELAPRLQEPSEADEEWMRHGVLLPDELCSSSPSFNPSEIEICSEQLSDALSSPPRKVQLKDGTSVFFFKRPMDTHSVEQEVQNYKKIMDAGLDDDLRISRLHGLVRSEDGLVFGLLLTYIDCGNGTLTCAAKPDSSLVLRRKWAEQVRSTVERLHAAGVVWGDAKAANVLVDGNDDAWVVDFGGGYTEGWVEKGSAGTVEGDLQGLGKILEFIGV